MGRDDPQLKLRLTEELKERVTEAAKANNRSVNSEIVARLEESFGENLSLPEDLMRRIKQSARLNERSVRGEILGTLDMMYPGLPSKEELLATLDEFLKRAEDEGLHNDPLFTTRLLEHLTNLNFALRNG
ncbi:Arc family DNA-binding protein [Rhizobium sp. YJ-22]|uniref:Arc family DNA-binding protein n=1 Tax=Rhizobium sp. YJ-22 TaxID=3037556 RepID=UPI002412D5C0|nr:Arc family DNA-binding protein [Rhizobium sp. YJ-22]MDG3575708.1 Arc family DNA-binding protein [Rhizobium sp. YJ-22]